jgi:hypothetical protein
LDKSNEEIYNLYNVNNLILEDSLLSLKDFMNCAEDAFKDLVDNDKTNLLSDDLFINCFGHYCTIISKYLKAEGSLDIT